MNSFSHDDLNFLDEEDSFMENLENDPTSNEVEISHHGITPTSTAITCDFHLNNIPGDSPGFSAGGCKHVKNKSYVVWPI